ncbi:Putative homoserine kinase type II (Protein kinase fold) (fragment) [Paraburkholderia ribeironis]|uniref:Putative homoserine kinase type II (Protein kinase fold) n=1 Tax=Paraburkholderia ribeironis TaxID=1247936 RepID=A0A1N7SDY2_9BURK
MDQPENVPRLRAVRSVIEAGSIAEVVGSQYALGQIDSCLFLRRGFNDVYELKLANGERKIVRLAAIRARGQSNIDFELSLLEHLKAEGVAVTAASRTRDGALWTDVLAPAGVRTLAVFDYLDGKVLGDGPDDIRLTGAELARIHDGARKYAGPESRYVLDIEHLLFRPLSRMD